MNNIVHIKVDKNLLLHVIVVNVLETLGTHCECKKILFVLEFAILETNHLRSVSEQVLV